MSPCGRDEREPQARPVPTGTSGLGRSALSRSRRPAMSNGSVRRVFVDTEFTDLPWTGRSELFWIGLADELGTSWSGVCSDIDLSAASEFTRSHVLPRLTADEPRLDRVELAAGVVDFCGHVDEFWAWCPSEQDLIALDLPATEAAEAWRRYWDWDFQLLRRLVSPWPDGWPTECRDLHRAATALRTALPPNPNAHHPAADAQWNADVFKALGGAEHPDPN
jgi:hypothetical protein